MMGEDMQASFGIIGLGTIGANLALQAIDCGLRVGAHDLNGVTADLQEAGVVPADSPGALAAELERPRTVCLYVPAGPAVDSVLSELRSVLEPGDIVVDGGNSYWKDSQRRHKELSGAGLHFVDLGTSGGAEGARHGACFMAGCDERVFPVVEPILRALAVEGGVVHAGPSGAGHFVKLVHNGIEFGMLQAIGEGVALLQRFYGENRDQLALVLEAWQHGTVIRSWLIDLIAGVYAERGNLQGILPHVEDTGEVNWLVSDALAMETPIPVISQSVMELVHSRDTPQQAIRAIAAMRHGFGDHPFGEDETLARHRRVSRVGPLSMPEDGA